jgi:pectate lyase
VICLAIIAAFVIPFTTRAAPPTHVPQAAAPIPAFPGAEGFGAATPGGRGGRIIEVTNLNDSGPGSFRAAVTATGPRIVIFRVGGTIELKSRVLISGNERSFLTIAGQTAPGGGIQFKGGDVVIGPDINDVIVRYLRFRLGPPGPEVTPERFQGLSSILVYGEPGKPTSNVIIDHCSIAWTPDDTGVWNQVSNVTIQWSIFSEGLLHDYPGFKEISRGLLLGTEPGDGARMRNISIHHNYFAHNDQRNPLVAADGPFEFVNNVVYNWGSFGTSVWNRGDGVKINLIGNYYKSGPANQSTTRYPIAVDPPRNPDGSIYVRDNLGPYRPDPSYDEWAIVGSGYDPSTYWTAPAPKALQRATPWPAAPIPVSAQPAQPNVDAVLKNAGATLPARDSVDQRVVNDFANNTGAVRKSTALRASDWPTLAAGTPPADSDKDGMPDAWEQRYGFNLSNGVDGPQDRDGDGYTNVEEFLNSTDPGASATIPTATPVPTGTPTANRHTGRVPAHDQQTDLVQRRHRSADQ